MPKIASQLFRMRYTGHRLVCELAFLSGEYTETFSPKEARPVLEHFQLALMAVFSRMGRCILAEPSRRSWQIGRWKVCLYPGQLRTLIHFVQDAIRKST